MDIFSTSASQVISDLRDEGSKIGLREQSKYGDTYYLLIDTTKKPMDDPRVRCALSDAIDRTELNDLVGAGLPQIANGVFSPGQEGYLDDNGQSTKQDLDTAKQLIDEYKQATGATSVQVELGNTAEPITSQASELLKGYWDQIGVDTKVDTVPQDQYITNALFGVPAFMIYQWRSHAGTIVDQQNLWWESRTSAPDGQLSINFGRLTDPDVDADAVHRPQRSGPGQAQGGRRGDQPDLRQAVLPDPAVVDDLGHRFEAGRQGHDRGDDTRRRAVPRAERGERRRQRPDHLHVEQRLNATK